MSVSFSDMSGNQTDSYAITQLKNGDVNGFNQRRTNGRNQHARDDPEQSPQRSDIL